MEEGREPTPDPGRPRRPSWLRQYARRKWDRMCEQLMAMGVLTGVDGDALAAYCQLYARWREAEMTVERLGATVTVYNEDGQVTGLIQRPEVKLSIELLREMNRVGKEFGLTPASRANLKMEKREDEKAEKGKGKGRFFGGGK